MEGPTWSVATQGPRISSLWTVHHLADEHRLVAHIDLYERIALVVANRLAERVGIVSFDERIADAITATLPLPDRPIRTTQRSAAPESDRAPCHLPWLRELPTAHAGTALRNLAVALKELRAALRKQSAAGRVPDVPGISDRGQSAPRSTSSNSYLIAITNASPICRETPSRATLGDACTACHFLCHGTPFAVRKAPSNAVDSKAQELRLTYTT